MIPKETAFWGQMQMLQEIFAITLLWSLFCDYSVQHSAFASELHSGWRQYFLQIQHEVLLA